VHTELVEVAERQHDQNVTAQEALKFAIEREYDGLVILGSPGAGKTTLTKYFLLCFATYLEGTAKSWANKLRSRYDDEKRFNGDDQPVVGVSWFDAQAYCHWLAEMQRAEGGGQSEKLIYKLPNEEEWEWAAGGGKREYPWGNEEPDETRANYDEKVGQTTPVGAYPKGATPEGLIDMAGNVWEWMENLYQEDKDWRALRGGSWFYTSGNLPCAARYFNLPVSGGDDVGFRVVVAQSCPINNVRRGPNLMPRFYGSGDWRSGMTCDSSSGSELPRSAG
jgi:formylglycine-generating enzyme required for sulfatase activity